MEGKLCCENLGKNIKTIEERGHDNQDAVSRQKQESKFLWKLNKTFHNTLVTRSNLKTIKTTGQQLTNSLQQF